MPDLIIKKSKLSGKGVFANREFKKGETVLYFEGKIFRRSELPIPYDSVDDRYMQVGPDTYLGPSGKYDDFVNHSCNPNCGIMNENGKWKLVAIKRIKRGEEITFDYSTTMDEDEWEMDCNCQAKNCRKRIRDFKYLPPKIQKKYISLGIVPEFILKNLKRIHSGKKHYKVNKYKTNSSFT
jgi:hypothetical protein